jgi:hypothetical protein
MIEPMKRASIVALLLANLIAAQLTVASAQPQLPAAGLDALYPAYLRISGSPDRLLVFGGEGAGAKANDAIYELTFSRTTASATWTARGALTVARREPEIAVFPGTTVVAIVGGMSAQGAPLNAIETFDYATGTRTLVATKLPAGLVHHQVVPCGAGPRVLVIGGNDGNAAVASLTVIELAAAAPERSVVAPLRDAVGRKITLKTARSFASATAVDDANSRLLVAGGETRKGAISSDGEIIEVTAECVAQRIASTPPLPERRTRGALTRTAAGSAIYYAGWNGESLALASFIYDAEANAWHAGAPLPEGYGRMRPPRAVNDTVIAIAGGDVGTLQGPAVSATNWAVYFPENGGEWTPGDAPKSMRHPRVGNALAFLDGALITVFGKDTTAAQPFAGLDTPE